MKPMVSIPVSPHVLIREAGRRAARAHVLRDEGQVRHWRTYAERFIGATPGLDRATVRHIFARGWEEA